MTSSAARVLVDLTHRDALEGIEACADSQGGWEILLRPGFLELDVFLEEIGSVDGILTSSCSDRLRAFAGRSIPIVAVGGSGPIEGVPHVRCDDRAVGRMGAEYFLEKGFSDLAFVYEVRAPFALARGGDSSRKPAAPGRRSRPTWIGPAGRFDSPRSAGAWPSGSPRCPGRWGSSPRRCPGRSTSRRPAFGWA